jgi:hypothetical protein
MPDLEEAIQDLELAHQELLAANPADFAHLERATAGRAAAINSVLTLVNEPGVTPGQLARIQQVHLGGALSLERVRLARQGLRKELASLSQEARVLSGYHAGSTTQS